MIVLSDPSKMKEYIFIATTIDGDTPAKQQGLRGEYIMLKFNDWNINSGESLFDKSKQYMADPKSIVVMKDNVVNEYYFESSIGVIFDLKYVGEEEKEKIIKKYEKWNDLRGL